MTAEIVRRGILPGALAGLAGGLVSGVPLSRVGALPPTASLVRAETPLAGFIFHVLVAVVLGVGFGVLVRRQRSGAGETFFWGLTYGGIWWFLGPLTLMPLGLLGFIAWDVHSAQEAFPSLLAYLLYGATTGLILPAFRGEVRMDPALRSGGAPLRGAMAGFVAAWVLGWATVSPLIGTAAGVVFSLLYPRPPRGSGPGLIRGTIYGFFWWVAGAMTLLPVWTGAGLNWSVEAARATFSAFVGSLLFGALLAVIYQWLDGATRLLFSDMVGSEETEGAGTESLRAVGRGALAGLIGGFIFTAMMTRVGFLQVAAGLAGSTSVITGLLVQLVIAEFIGVSYGLLFRRQSFDVGSALGWGIAYGFFWWVLGPLTLLPVLQGVSARWTVEVAAGLFGSLIAHLAYGAGLGIVFHLLEARHNPWWIPRSQVEADRVARHKEQLLTSAPALWALVVTIALTLPIVLST